MKRIAITGASGFIGRHVVAELLTHEVEIVAITRDATKLNRLPKTVSIIEMDIARPASDCFSQIGCPDVLIHLAWDGLPHYKSLHHFETELPRHYCFLKAVIESGLRSLLVTGTCFEYGMQEGPLGETLETRPNNPYGFAKDTLRRQLSYLQTVHPFALIWARLFYLYGEGQSSASLYPKLKEAVLRGDKVFNMSFGEQLRDYLPVTDVAKQIVVLALASKDIGTINNICNICSGKPISVRALIEHWLKENDWSIALNLGYYPYPDYEPMAFWGERSFKMTE